LSTTTGRPEPPVEIETGSTPSASIIWMHGLGADGHDFEGLVPELCLPADLAVRFVFPHAPYRAVTLNAGYVMRAWYDIATGKQGLTQDATHIAESEKTVTGLIQRENARGIRTDRIVLAGFSQGAVIALTAGLRHPEPLAGILALSAPLADPEGLAGEVPPANVAIPIFLAHGRQDPLVPFALGQRVHQILRDRGLAVEWHEYQMPHSVCFEEVRDMAAWLGRVLTLPGPVTR
jgi:phospholipase/carboxylesterase